MPGRSPHLVHPSPPRFFTGRDDGYTHPIDCGHFDGFGGGMVHESSDA
jgi:hypothetical protein